MPGRRSPENVSAPRTRKSRERGSRTETTPPPAAPRQRKGTAEASMQSRQNRDSPERLARSRTRQTPRRQSAGGIAVRNLLSGWMPDRTANLKERVSETESDEPADEPVLQNEDVPDSEHQIEAMIPPKPAPMPRPAVRAVHTSQPAVRAVHTSEPVHTSQPAVRAVHTSEPVHTSQPAVRAVHTSEPVHTSQPAVHAVHTSEPVHMPQPPVQSVRPPEQIGISQPAVHAVHTSQPPVPAAHMSETPQIKPQVLAPAYLSEAHSVPTHGSIPGIQTFSTPMPAPVQAPLPSSVADIDHKTQPAPVSSPVDERPPTPNNFQMPASIHEHLTNQVDASRVAHIHRTMPEPARSTSSPYQIPISQLINARPVESSAERNPSKWIRDLRNCCEATKELECRTRTFRSVLFQSDTTQNELDSRIREIIHDIKHLYTSLTTTKRGLRYECTGDAYDSDEEMRQLRITRPHTRNYTRALVFDQSSNRTKYAEDIDPFEVHPPFKEGNRNEFLNLHRVLDKIQSHLIGSGGKRPLIGAAPPRLHERPDGWSSNHRTPSIDRTDWEEKLSKLQTCVRELVDCQNNVSAQIRRIRSSHQSQTHQSPPGRPHPTPLPIPEMHSVPPEHSHQQPSSTNWKDPYAYREQM